MTPAPSSGGQKNILFLTVRPSPASKLLDDLTARLDPDIGISEVSLLEGLSTQDLDGFRAEAGQARISTPLIDGKMIELSQQKMGELALRAIARNMQSLYDLIILTSTGIPYVPQHSPRVITAEQAIEAAITAIAMPRDRIGIVVPLARQMPGPLCPELTRYSVRWTHARHADRDELRQAAKTLAGCDYIVLNALCYDEADRCLMAALTGKSVLLPRRIIAAAINLVLGASEARPPQTDRLQRLMRNLTPREREVMSLICKGLSNKEIARDLGISHRTVEIHRANILRKMNARTSGALISEMASIGIR